MGRGLHQRKLEAQRQAQLKSVEQKKALLKEVKDTYAPATPKATKAKAKATRAKRTKRVKSLAKRTKKVQKTEQELRVRLNMTEADIEVLRAIPLISTAPQSAQRHGSGSPC